jgi:uncharacterized protein
MFNMTDVEITRHLLDVLSPLRPMAVYGFGSFFRGEARVDSDVDVAYLTDGDVSPEENFRLQQDLAVRLNRDVDLIPLRTADTVLKAQIIGSGRPLFCRDSASTNAFEMYALSDYARLNEERREILERVENEGTIYG